MSNFPIEGYGTGPVRVRILRHWSRSSDGMKGGYVITIEPRWPIIRAHSWQHPDDFFTILGTKDCQSLDVILEHFVRQPKQTNGDCNGDIASIDLFSLVRWLK